MKKIYTFLFILSFVPLTFSQLIPKFGLGINDGIVIPQGDIRDLYKTGYGGSFSMILPLPIPLEISVSVGYYTFKFNNEYFATQLKNATGSTLGFDIDAPLNIIPLTVDARYYILPVSIRPYAEVSIGIGIASSINVIPNFTSGNSIGIKTEEKSETKQYISVGAGVLIGVGLDADFDINIRYALPGQKFNKLQASGRSMAISAVTGTYLGINAGLRLKL